MSTDLELFTFENQDIRTVMVDGLRCAVAGDICGALDIGDTRQAVERLDEADRYRVPVRSGGQTRHMWVVTEDGATDLVLDSRKPEARRFRRFLTHEVWPAIRDTGSYSTAPALTGPHLVAAALVEANRMLEELQPKAGFYDELMDSDGTYSFLAASKILGWGRNVMMAHLRRVGVLQGNNLPYQRYEHHFKVVPTTYVNRKTGETVPTATTTVLPSGLEFLRKKLASVRDGQLTT